MKSTSARYKICYLLHTRHHWTLRKLSKYLGVSHETIRTRLKEVEAKMID